MRLVSFGEYVEQICRGHKVEPRKGQSLGLEVFCESFLTHSKSGMVRTYRTLQIRKAWQAVFAPDWLNWASRRMYNTHKRVVLYELYGLILGVCDT